MNYKDYFKRKLVEDLTPSASGRPAGDMLEPVESQEPFYGNRSASSVPPRLPTWHPFNTRPVSRPSDRPSPGSPGGPGRPIRDQQRPVLGEPAGVGRPGGTANRPNPIDATRPSGSNPGGGNSGSGGGNPGFKVPGQVESGRVNGQVPSRKIDRRVPTGKKDGRWTPPY
jgi:hypothetical protein